MTKLLDLDELNKVGTPYGRDKNIETYNYLLEQCHKKIKEYNKVNRSKYCYYKPPIFLTGRPMYDYYDMINYLIEQLEQNGLFAKFFNEHGILICWDPRFLNQNQYQTMLSINQSKTEPQIISTVSPRIKHSTHRVDRSKPVTKTTQGGRKPTTSVVNLLKLEDDNFPINLDTLGGGRDNL